MSVVLANLAGEIVQLQVGLTAHEVVYARVDSTVEVTNPVRRQSQH